MHFLKRSVSIIYNVRFQSSFLGSFYTMSSASLEPVSLPQKRPLGRTESTKPPKKIKRKYNKKKNVDPTSPGGVLRFEIDHLCKEHGLSLADISNPMDVILNDNSTQQKYHRIVDEVNVLSLTSNGEGIALIDGPAETNTKKQVAIVPFGLPGDVLSIKVFKSHPLHVECDLLKIITPSSMRNDSLVDCKYFGVCSGCQYQPIEYPQQLLLKRDTIVNAYKFFAPILTANGKLPEMGSTVPSPLQYSYRTKLTPHFEIPRRKNEDFQRPSFGFGSKGRPKFRPEIVDVNSSIVDIEECLIGTSIINTGLSNERKKFGSTYNNYQRGATILLRENTTPVSDPPVETGEGSRDDTGEISKAEVELPDGSKQLKTCVTEPRQIVTEIINGNKFQFSAGEFFQNNNSILPDIIKYVQDNLKLDPNGENYLVDAYCGSGLFSISCASSVKKVIGVEISADSVKFATHNAELNNIENCEFITGKAEKIFADIQLPRDQTSIILDPPRKGCDDVFLTQLSEFKPKKIIYISCNVHSQARDLEYFINNTSSGSQYRIDSIRGFDFFPQTHHVEGVAVLSLI
ncbi:BA75_00632T0 [Komagataella pastoris]|uniref:tRNA (uracil(54)-C(5))-methyltransferase n=1 Tax=Komagataella pastoris TaxID=4922 RepID=A0A1B2J7V9_PICPA|nr:BA75_00632T0 [Komagataella pastoris]